MRKQFASVPNTFVLRLYDVTTGFKNQNNPCDLIVFKNGTLNLFECKAIHGNTLNFKSHIRKNQWDKLLEYSFLPGVNAGIICWFIDLEKTLFIDIQYLDLLKSKQAKSFNINKSVEVVPTIEIKGQKKKVFFDYNLDEFLKEISYGE